MTGVSRTPRDRSAPLGNEAWRLLYDYWRSKHINGLPPTRDDIDPITEVPRLVANMMIIDVTGEGFIYRYIGSEIVNHTGQDMTGHPVGGSRKYSLIQSQWVDALDVALRTQEPSLVMYRFEVDIGAKHLGLILPLTPAPGGVAKILAGSFFDGYFPPGLHAEGMTVLEIPA